jgi:hypothetical protein
MNGVYARVWQLPQGMPQRCSLIYRKWPLDRRDDMRGWMLSLCEAGPGAVGGLATEWLLVDPSRRERFGHKGETIIPGAGAKWQHLHRAAGGGEEAEAVVRPGAGDDLDELPWQVALPSPVVVD